MRPVIHHVHKNLNTRVCISWNFCNYSHFKFCKLSIPWNQHTVSLALQNTIKVDITTILKSVGLGL